MRISVILSAYNRPRYLELTLEGFARQSDRDFEIVVADDGSGPEVAEVLGRVRRETGLDIAHVWHEDLGFRKTQILNRAILVASGDYLIFTDSDCIPREDLVAVHRRHARRGRFVAGSYVKLPQGISDGVSAEDVRSGRVFDLGWLRSEGWRPGRKAMRITRSRVLARVFDLLTPTGANFQGNNVSAWRADVLAVNGFDNDWGYGSEDRALGARLGNAGITGIQMRHRCVTMHLEHPRPYTDRGLAKANRRRLREVERSGTVRTGHGIAQLAADPTLRVVWARADRPAAPGCWSSPREPVGSVCAAAAPEADVSAGHDSKGRIEGTDAGVSPEPREARESREADVGESEFEGAARGAPSR